jgi:hypothetical protein
LDEETSDGTDTHEPELATLKPKKMKPSVRGEIKIMHAKAAAENENGKEKVRI